jgi:hypothetical protein
MPDDELAMRRAMERATLAQTLLENEIVKEAFDTLAASYVATWRATAWHDDEARKSLWLADQALGKVKAHLELTAAHGRMASRQIERDFRPPKRFGIV